MVRIALVSNLFPTRDAPSNGTFITERIAAHRAIGNDIQAYALTPVHSSLARIARGNSKVAGETLNPASIFRSAEHSVGLLDAYHSARRVPRRSILQGFAEAVEDSLATEVEVIHAHGMYTYAAGAIAKELSERLSVPYVVSIHGSDVNLRLTPPRLEFYKTVLESADATIGVSRSLFDVLRSRGVNVRRPSVIPNGIDPDIFSRAKRPADDGRTPRVLFVGRLEHVKGADRLPAIADELAKTVPEFSIDIVGRGTLEPLLREKLRMFDTTFHGVLERSAVASAMARSDLLLLPSRNEGWPTVVLEAHATGTPVLGADVGGVKEAVGGDPRFLISPGSNFESRFAERAAQLLGAKPEMSGLRSRALGHSWVDVARQEAEVYQRSM